MSFVPNAQPRPSLAILVAVSSINPLALNIFVPSMPGMERAFSTSYATVQLSLSLYLVSVAVAQIVIGPLSDQYGRRPVMIGGMALFVVGSVVCRLAPDIGTLIAGRILQGAGGCAGLVLSRAIVRDLYERDRAASMIGFVTMGMAVAPAIGPGIGGLLDERFGWTASFDLLLGIGVAVLLATVVSLHETHFDRGRATSLRALAGGFAALWRVPMFRSFALTSAFTSSVYFAFLGGAPYVTQKLMGAGPSESGAYFILVAFGYMLGNFLTGRYAARFGIARMIMAGTWLAFGACLTVGALFAVGLYHPLSIFAPMFLLGMGNGLSLPSTLAGAVSVRPDLAGAASGLVGSLQIGGGALATVVTGHILSDSPWPLVAVMVLLAVGALVLARPIRSLSD